MITASVLVRRFGRYVFSGVLANAVDIGLFLLLTYFNVYFVLASVLSGAVGFFAAYFLHKHVTYRDSGASKTRFIRYSILTAFNYAALNMILFALVTYGHIPEGWAKVCSNGLVVLWNFFLYKRFVYRT
jgi:putative flippase GtrA